MNTKIVKRGRFDHKYYSETSVPTALFKASRANIGSTWLWDADLWSNPDNTNRNASGADMDHYHGCSAAHKEQMNNGKLATRAIIDCDPDGIFWIHKVRLVLPDGKVNGRPYQEAPARDSDL